MTYVTVKVVIHAFAEIYTSYMVRLKLLKYHLVYDKNIQNLRVINHAFAYLIPTRNI